MQNIEKVIQGSRDELQVWWDKCYYSREQRNAFDGFYDGMLLFIKIVCNLLYDTGSLLIYLIPFKRMGDSCLASHGRVHMVSVYTSGIENNFPMRCKVLYLSGTIDHTQRPNAIV